MKHSILIVDDDLYIINLLDHYFKRKGFRTFTLTRGKPVLELIREETINVVLCDVRLPDMSGIELLQYIKQLSPDTEVILMTAYADIRAAVESIKTGACDYLSKPLFPDQIHALIRKTCTANKSWGSVPDNEFITGNSHQMFQLINQAKLVAPTDMSVLIQGETGSGKEYVAELIHAHSQRSQKKFVAIDCGAIPRELAASELFGHVKGAFTGAVSNKAGYFEQANGGTIFLDEIANLSYETQVKLLRAIQQKVITRVGDSKPISVDVRIICASNRNLLKACADGYFREDLYHRLNEFKVELPALRHRGEDVLIFARHFLKQANHQLKKEVKDFDTNVMHAFRSYSWHGNLRELRNVVKRCVLVAASDIIAIDCLPEELQRIRQHTHQNPQSSDDGMNLKVAARDAEKQVVQAALKEANNNKSLAAKLLKIDRKTLYNKIDKLGI
ncbi:MAG: sigma-54 dependent transcriptional regulator [Bacteroidales bacterium]